MTQSYEVQTAIQHLERFSENHQLHSGAAAFESVFLHDDKLDGGTLGKLYEEIDAKAYELKVLADKALESLRKL